MILVSNDSSWQPLIDFYRLYSYFVVASCVAVLYDWALTLGQEIELIWRRRCSLMTVLYLSVRYIGILYSAILMLASLPSVSLTDAGCAIIFQAQGWTGYVVMNVMLPVIMITRIHAMYQRSRKMLVFLVVILLPIMIACGILVGKLNGRDSEELALSGTYQCVFNSDPNGQLLNAGLLILTTAWEVLALCLSVWIAIKHFRELQRPLTEWIIGDCITVLIKTHVIYFAAFAAASCLNLSLLSPKIVNSLSVGSLIVYGSVETVTFLMLFVLGPRLILSVRASVADSDEGTCMTAIAFQEHIHDVSTHGDV